MKRVAVWILVIVVGTAAALYGAYRTNPRVPTAEFGGVSLIIEPATTTAARERGLSGRESIPADYGMLFVFDEPNHYGFWMKDMLVPIDIFWLDDKGQVVSMVQSATPDSYPRVFYPAASASYVLETAAGFAEAHGVATGTTLSLKNVTGVSK